MGRQFRCSLYWPQDFPTFSVECASIWPFGPAMGLFHPEAQRLSEVNCILWPI